MNDNGSYPVNCWQAINRQWYYFGNTGYMYYSTWLQSSGKWYYLSDSGAMVPNQWVGNYYSGQDGAMLTNTMTPDGYWVDESGAYVPQNSSSSDSSDNTARDQNSVWLGDGYYSMSVNDLSSVSTSNGYLYIEGSLQYYPMSFLVTTLPNALYSAEVNSSTVCETVVDPETDSTETVSMNSFLQQLNESIAEQSGIGVTMYVENGAVTSMTITP
jgi:hypothetical protein